AGGRSWALRLGGGLPGSLAFFCSDLLRRLVGWGRQSRQNAGRWTRRPADGPRRGLGPGCLPEFSGDGERVDTSRFPPQRLVAGAVELAVVQAAERNGEFVADLAPEGELLGEADVVRLGRLAPANEAGSGGHVLEVLLVANAPRFPECEDALVDAFGRAFL